MDELDIRYTNKRITPFDGLKTVKRFYDKSGLQELIRSLPLPSPGSNRGYNSVDLIEGFIVSVLLGSHQLAHSGFLQHYNMISELFGWSKGIASENKRVFFDNLLQKIENISPNMTFRPNRKFLMN